MRADQPGMEEVAQQKELSARGKADHEADNSWALPLARPCPGSGVPSACAHSILVGVAAHPFVREQNRLGQEPAMGKKRKKSGSRGAEVGPLLLLQK
jgi:hypothetical protein